MIIKPRVGVQIANFGMSKSQVTESLGQPDKKFMSETGDEIFCYYSEGVALQFEPENANRLGWIQVVSPDAELWGKKVMGLRRAEVEALIDTHLSESKSKDDYGSWISISWEDSWLELHFSLDHLTQFNLGVPYDGDDVPIWPTSTDDG